MAAKICCHACMTVRQTAYNCKFIYFFPVVRCKHREYLVLMSFVKYDFYMSEMKRNVLYFVCVIQICMSEIDVFSFCFYSFAT